MIPGIDRLKMLKVRDVMSQKVVGVLANLTMPEAAKSFAQHDVHSAPVVDDQGRCVGMISTADFIKREHPRSKTSVDSSNGNPSGDTVSCFMTPAPRSVAADELLLNAARVMLTEHIHHLPVLENERPIGVISTMDLVAVLINAVDEVDVLSTPRRE